MTPCNGLHEPLSYGVRFADADAFVRPPRLERSLGDIGGAQQFRRLCSGAQSPQGTPAPVALPSVSSCAIRQHG